MTKMVCDKEMCVNVNGVSKCHARHVKRRQMPPSATPATQSAAASRHQTQHNPISACHAKRRVDVAKCHACHVKRRRMHQVPRLPRKVPRRPAASRETQARHQTQPSPISTRPATQNDGGYFAKCHACHVKRRRMPPSATPATQSAAASRGVTGDLSAPYPAQSHKYQAATLYDGGCTKCHACHAKCRGRSLDVTKCHAARHAKCKLCVTK